VPRLTGVRRARPGRVALEVDGRLWRTVPDEVAVGCGLAPGVELERPLLRRIRTELRRAEALAAAARALERRDLSRSRLEERLRARGVAPAAERHAVAALADAGLVDDERVAARRAAALAERGYGDAAIAARLEHEGFGEDLARAVVAELPPESRRAGLLVERMTDRRKAWAQLARRGFAADSLEEALGPLDGTLEPG
jgi:SOS response regulatory protein OraA/RecX